MDFRKLIRFGNSSHVISLPKDWIRKHNLERGNVVFLLENSNNELILSAKDRSDEREEKTIIMDVEGKDFETIKRYIYSKYIGGFDVITLVGESEIKKHNQDLRNVFNNLMAFEIIEQTQKKIVAKDFLDIKVVSIDSIIRRVDILVRAMLEDFTSVCKSEPDNLAQRDKDINKLVVLAMRTLKKSLSRPSLQKEIGADIMSVLSIWDIFQNLELFADELKRCARYAYHANAKKDQMSKFFELFRKVQEDYIAVMKAWFSKDEKIAYNVAKEKDKVLGECQKLRSAKVDLSFSHAVERLMAMETFIRNIARAVYE